MGINIKTIFLKPLIINNDEILVLRPNIDIIDYDIIIKIAEIINKTYPNQTIIVIPQGIKLDKDTKEHLIKELKEA